MGIITKIEEKIAGFVEMPFKGTRYLDFVAIEIALKRVAEAHKKTVFSRIYVNPYYLISLDKMFITNNAPFITQFKDLLKTEINKWLLEKGYETIQPLKIIFQVCASEDKTFEIKIIKDISSFYPHLIHTKTNVTFPLKRSVSIIGRGDDCHIGLSDDSVSIKHAKIVYENGRLTLTDLYSRNGTRINQKKVRKAYLEEGDKIIIGETALIYYENLKMCGEPTLL